MTAARRAADIPPGFGHPLDEAMTFDKSGVPLFWIEPQGVMPFDHTPIYSVHMALPGSQRTLAAQAHLDAAILLVRALRAYRAGRPA